jgi:hypothetical protein
VSVALSALYDGDFVIPWQADEGSMGGDSDAGPESAIFTWGLNSTHGRLGLGTLASSRRSFDPTKPPAVNMHVHVPEEVALPLRELGLDGTVAGRESVRWRLGEVELAMEGLWVGIEAEEDVD